MPFQTILYSIAFLGLLIGSYSDIKTREVPDWLSYSLIFSGLGLRLMFSLMDFNWTIFLQGLSGFAIFVAIGYLMYYAGQWGGGDSKLLMGLGALIGLNFSASTIPPLAVFFINLLIVGALYGTLWIIILAVKNSGRFSNEVKALLRNRSKLKAYVLAASLLLFVVVLLIQQEIFFKTSFLVLAIMPAASFYLWVSVKAVENIAFYKRVNPMQLTEGDWIVNKIVIDGKKIAGPKDLGIEQDQIDKLIDYHKKGNNG